MKSSIIRISEIWFMLVILEVVVVEHAYLLSVPTRSDWVNAC